LLTGEAIVNPALSDIDRVVIYVFVGAIVVIFIWFAYKMFTMP